jgi:hypothetical protein
MKRMARYTRYKEKHKRLGLCIDCNRKAQDGLLRCRFHAQKARKNERERYRRKKLEKRGNL